MSHKILCFGEVLWDCLPEGLFLGGAPLNVASHLTRLGAQAAMVSAVGDDVLGLEALRRIQARGLAVTDVALRKGEVTGTARVLLDGGGNATYLFPEPCAWDAIPAGGAPLLMPGMDAVVFGSLAIRSPANEALLESLLEVPGPLRIMDVNLRAPYFDRLSVIVLAQKADVLKVNREELAILSGMESEEDVPEGPLQMLSTITGVRRICLSLGEEGAVFWDHGTLTRADAPPVEVVDTVGAGDALTAALAVGLCAGEEASVFLPRACKLGALVASRSGAVPDYDGKLF